MTTMLFMASPYERTLEKVMMSVPNFSPRGHGVMVMSRFEYTAEICGCRNCTERIRSKCRHTACVCFTERTEAGVIPFSELLNAAFLEVKNRAFRSRINQYMKESGGKPMLYRGDDHKALFEKAIAVRNIQSAAFLAALYLLTADNRLWSKAKSFVSGTAINFGAIRLGDISVEAYALFMAAKDLYGANEVGTGHFKHITISDLTDKEIIGHKIFVIICNAMTFRRYGMNALKVAEKEGGRR
jgi:hypothetical protein